MRTNRVVIGILMTVSLLAIDAAAQTDSSFSLRSWILSVLKSANMFNGPASVSNALITARARTGNVKPTAAQIQYYFYYAYATYCPDELKDLSCGYCQKFRKDVNYHTVLTNDDYDTLAFITTSKRRKEIVIAFRGTVLNMWNILLDFDFLNTAIDNIQIHGGFYKAAMSLYSNVVASVNNQLKKNRGFKIVVTGHSLGGAISRVTQYLLLKFNQFPDTTYELYTYGEPRVGNKAFAEFFNRQTITTARTVNKRDLVSHVPPTSAFGTEILFDYYVHPLTEFWIKDDAQQMFCNQSFYEDPHCSDSLKLSYSASDHSNYFNVSTMSCKANNSGNSSGSLSSRVLGFFSKFF